MYDITRIGLAAAKLVMDIFPGIPTKGQLMKLCEQGVIRPYREATGTGSNRLFDWYNLFEIGIWRELFALSISGMNSFGFLEVLREKGLRESGLPQGKKYVLFGMNLSKPETHHTSWQTRAEILSSAELIQILSEGLEAHSFNNNMVIIDIEKIHAVLLDYFYGGLEQQ